MSNPSLTVRPVDESFSAIVLRPAAPGPARLVLAGELDLAAGGALRTSFVDLLTAMTVPRCVQIDLAGVSFLDSAGIGELMRARAVLARLGVSVQLLGAGGQCARMMGVAARLGWLDAAALSPVTQA